MTHDRYFLDNVAGWILELDRGQGIPFEGNYSEWLMAKSKRLEVFMHIWTVVTRHTHSWLLFGSEDNGCMADDNRGIIHETCDRASNVKAFHVILS